MKKTLGVLTVLLAGILLVSLPATEIQAQSGVGIMPGTIRVDEPLLPGGRYSVPSVQVLNNGSEPSDYEIGLAFVGNQEELQPSSDFIILSPTSFYLEAGSSEVVSLSLRIPLRAEPGDYLAYIEAHSVVTGEGSGMQIGVAAATKLYFTVKPASSFVGVMNSIANFFTRNAPASYIVVAVIVVGLVIFSLRRRIRVDIRISRKND